MMSSNRMVASMVLATFAAAGGIAAAQPGVLGAGRPLDATIKPGAPRPAQPAPVFEPGRPAADQVAGGEAGGGVADVGITLLDFESSRQNDAAHHEVGRMVVEDGFAVSVDDLDEYGFSINGTQNSWYNGSTALYNNTVDGTNFLYALDYAPFSLEFMEFSNFSNNGPVTITVHGVKYDGTEVTRTCTTLTGDNREEAFYFNGFNDLYYVYWTQSSPFHQFDNIGVVRAPIVMDFQNLEQAVNDAVPWGHTVFEDGFVVDNTGEVSELKTFGTLEARYPGSTALFNNTAGGTVTLSQYGGGTFNLHSIDISNLNNTGPVTVTFTGHRPGGSTMQKSYTTAGTPNALETVRFNGFNNIESLTWTQESPYHQFDNVVLSRGQQTLDFIDLSIGDDQSHDWGAAYRADGFRIEAGEGDSGLFTFGSASPNFPGSTSLFNNTVDGLVHVETIDGTAFQLVGIEIAPLNATDHAPVSFVGHKTDGSQITQQFATSGQDLRLETFTFDESWRSLKDVEWTQEAPFHQFDNVRLVRQTNLMDCQKLEHVDNQYTYIGKTYLEQGFKLSKGANEAHDFATNGTLATGYNGSTSIFNNTGNGQIILTALDGGDFDLLQIDLSTLGAGFGPASVDFVGTRTDGVQVTQSFTIADSSLTQQTCRLKGFSTLAKVEWTQAFPFHQFDNIVAVESVPEVDCYADFDGNGVLDLFDFLAYVNAFNAADQKANCDGNGSLDLFDFLCYVNAFNAGC